MEVLFDIRQECGLIAFDGEVVVAFAAAHVAGEVALGQQSIGGNVLVFEVQRLQQRCCDFDFVGLFEGVRIARYGQDTDFF